MAAVVDDDRRRTRRSGSRKHRRKRRERGGTVTAPPLDDQGLTNSQVSQRVADLTVDDADDTPDTDDLASLADDIGPSLDADGAASLWEKVKDCAIFEASDGEVHAAFDAWFGGRLGNRDDIDVRERFQVAGELEGAGGVALAGRAAGSVDDLSLPFGMDATQYRGLVEVVAAVGVQGSSHSNWRLRLGDEAYTQLRTVAKGFAGAVAKAKAEGRVVMMDGPNGPFPVGLQLSGSASAFAGVKASGEGDLTLGLNPATALGLGVEVGGAVDLTAGAEAKAEGGIDIDLTRGRFEFLGEAGAFAGVKASGTVRGTAKMYGRRLLRVGVTGTTEVGAGGHALGQVKAKGGNLRVKFEIDGSLGFGGGGGGEVDVDVKPLWVLCRRTRARVYWKRKSRQDALAVADDYRSVFKSRIRPRLEKYRDFKVEQLRMNDASSYVKMEKIQYMIDEEFPRTVLKSLHLTPQKEAAIDSALVALIEDVFGDVPSFGRPVGIDVTVKRCKIKNLQTRPRDIANLLGGAVEASHLRGKDAGASAPLTGIGL